MSHVRLVVLDGLYAGAGATVLAALGVVRSRATLVRSGGLAILLGWGIFGLATSYLLAAGLSAVVWETLLAVAVALAAVSPLLLRVPRPPPPARIPRPASPLALACAILLGVYVAVLLARALVSGVTWWDGWAFWIPKAMTIVYFHGLDTAEGGFTSFANPEYPPLVPGLQALGFRFIGRVDATPLVFQDWVLAAATLWAVYALLGPRVPSRILWPSLLMFAALPNFGRLLGALTGDQPLALTFAVAGVAALLWRVERVPAYGVVACVLLAVLPMIKREGLFLSVALVLAIAAVTAPRFSREQLRLAALVAVPIVAVAPWRLWLARHDVHGVQDYALSALLDPSYLIDRSARLRDVLEELPQYFLDPKLWLLTVPLTVATAVATWRRAPEAARLAVVVLVLTFAAIATAFWISTISLATHIATTAARVPAAPVFLCAALLPVLLAAWLSPDDGRRLE